ncbi:CHAD domain-containing protein [Ectopseudomonas toyotomiensis]|uniref:CHAD domain-containing protein n=2 Tax=Ectopseudomonas toyotomiensis TaxID=554344 RepID=A0ABD7DVS0_9GAMM|nr:CHAD domain-containing protein [Pseudomonas toyotomiensis]
MWSMPLVDQMLSQVLVLQVNLYACKARLEADSDPEALHDLRIAVRRIRSLLHPLRRHPAVVPLRHAASEVGQITTPVRDLEVLAAELGRRGLTACCSARLAGLRSRYRDILASPELERLFTRLDLWPDEFRAAQREGDFDNLAIRIVNQITKQSRQLMSALGNTNHDPHELRLLAKRLRYCAEAFPRLSPLPSATFQALKQMQSVLGDWHDRYQWCLRANQEEDLQGLVPVWEEESVQLLAESELIAAQLSSLLRPEKKDSAPLG